MKSNLTTFLAVYELAKSSTVVIRSSTSTIEIQYQCESHTALGTFAAVCRLSEATLFGLVFAFSVPKTVDGRPQTEDRRA